MNENNNQVVSLPRGHGTDEVMRPSPNEIVTRSAIERKWLAIFFQLFGIMIDLYLIGKYFVGGEWLYFALTVAFVYGPSIVNSFISINMYNEDDERVEDAMHNKLLRYKYYWPIVPVPQLASFLRSWESLLHAQKSYDYGMRGDWTNQRKYYKNMLKEDQDIALLGLVKDCLKAAPQLIFMLDNMLKYPRPYDFKFALQVLQIIITLTSLGYSMTNFKRIWRLAQENKTIITTCGLVFQFFSHSFIVVSRIVSVSVVASTWTLNACLWFLVHWFVITIWIYCDSRYAPYVAPLERIRSVPSCVLGVVYFFFTYVKVHDRPIFSRYAFHIATCFVENLVACYCWAHSATDEIAARWYFEFLVFLCIVPYVLGILFKIVYYKLEHIMKEQDRAILTTMLVETS